MIREPNNRPKGPPPPPPAPQSSRGGYRAPDVPAPATPPRGGSSGRPPAPPENRGHSPIGRARDSVPGFILYRSVLDTPSTHRAIDDWPTPPARRQRGRVLVALLGALVGALFGGIAAVVVVLWILTL